jgi:hypothetical protein
MQHPLVQISGSHLEMLSSQEKLQLSLCGVKGEFAVNPDAGFLPSGGCRGLVILCAWCIP